MYISQHDVRSCVRVKRAALLLHALITTVQAGPFVPIKETPSSTVDTLVAGVRDSQHQHTAAYITLFRACLLDGRSTLIAEPLRLAYEASRTLLPLSSFIVAADLTMERLWYKVTSRSVELGDFALGLRASACLQVCLGQREGGGGGDRLADGARDIDNGASCSVVLASEGGGEDEALRLRSFAPPGASRSVALAKLVSGASLNACRCCLEVGTAETLRLMTGGLGRGAGRWIDRVGELGDDATAGECACAAGEDWKTKRPRRRGVDYGWSFLSFRSELFFWSPCPHFTWMHADNPRG